MSLADRILGPLDLIAATAAARLGLPDPRYSVPWSYAVIEADERTFSGRAVNTRCPHPDLVNVPNMPGIPGTLIKPAVGSIVGVLFLDGDPSQPRVVSWDTNTAELVTVDATTLLKLGPSAAAVQIAGAGPAIHRVGDTSNGGTFSAGDGVTTTLVYSDPNGVPQWGVLFANSGGPCTAAPATPLPVAPLGTVSAKASTGSSKATCGG